MNQTTYEASVRQRIEHIKKHRLFFRWMVAKKDFLVSKKTLVFPQEENGFVNNLSKDVNDTSGSALSTDGTLTYYSLQSTLLKTRLQKNLWKTFQANNLVLPQEPLSQELGRPTTKQERRKKRLSILQSMKALRTARSQSSEQEADGHA